MSVFTHSGFLFCLNFKWLPASSSSNEFSCFFLLSSKYKTTCSHWGWWGQGKIVIVYFRGEGPLPRRPSREHSEREKQTGRRSPRSTHPSQQAWNNDGWKLNQESESINENLTPARVHSTAWNFSFRKSVFRLNTWGEHKIFPVSTPETTNWV